MKISIIEMLKFELQNEAKTTKKMLSIIPNDKYDWKPHEKSMTIRSLASHIAELPSWILMTMNTDELDFAKSEYKPVQIENTEQLLEFFDKTLSDGQKGLEEATEEKLEVHWKLRNGDEIYSDTSKYEVIRMAYSQIIHHRAQIGVYLRLLNVPIPGSYGPSADDPTFN